MEKALKPSELVYTLREQLHTEGYIVCKCSNHPYTTVPKLHRIVMELFLGRFLNKNEIVHHKDGNKLNNNIDNLEVMTVSDHMKLHLNNLNNLHPQAEIVCKECRKVKTRFRKAVFCSDNCKILFFRKKYKNVSNSNGTYNELLERFNKLQEEHKRLLETLNKLSTNSH